MCGRYALAEEPKNIYRRYDVQNENKHLQLPLYNIAPGSIVPVITRNSPNKLELMKWGLVPFWAKDPKIGYRMINARAETASEKPSFREPFKKRRCLIPATGFFEWKKVENENVPYLFQLKSGGVFSLAGLYDVWNLRAEDRALKTCTIITTVANKKVANVHERMPVILTKEHEDIWLNPESGVDVLTNILIPSDENLLEGYEVSKDVNSPKNQSEELLQEIT